MDWQDGERELALRWVASLNAKLNTKPEHADDCLWLERLAVLFTPSPVSDDIAGLVERARYMATPVNWEEYGAASPDAIAEIALKLASALTRIAQERDAYVQATKDNAAIALHNITRAEAAEARLSSARNDALEEAASQALGLAHHPR